MNFQLINVGIADLKVAKNPDVLRTVLGSCVAICLYDSKTQVAGMAHIMLPVQKNADSNPKKYADMAIPELILMMENEGCSRGDITAKITGGAVVLRVAEGGLMGEIGLNNIIKTREVLRSLNIPLCAEEVGGDRGRTIDFFSDDGRLKIKSLGSSEKII
jgi:chemotaxis protein CheD